MQTYPLLLKSLWAMSFFLKENHLFNKEKHEIFECKIDFSFSENIFDFDSSHSSRWQIFKKKCNKRFCCWNDAYVQRVSKSSHHMRIFLREMSFMAGSKNRCDVKLWRRDFWPSLSFFYFLQYVILFFAWYFS